jgi:hypothetical protein
VLGLFCTQYKYAKISYLIIHLEKIDRTILQVPTNPLIISSVQQGHRRHLYSPTRVLAPTMQLLTASLWSAVKRSLFSEIGKSTNIITNIITTAV